MLTVEHRRRAPPEQLFRPAASTIDPSTGNPFMPSEGGVVLVSSGKYEHRRQAITHKKPIG
jgi:hypothetical protein